MVFGETFLAVTACSRERARWLHLARSGSQSQRAIWFFLPARGTSHIINGNTECHVTFYVLNSKYLFYSAIQDRSLQGT